jgi:hypothetical protein
MFPIHPTRRTYPLVISLKNDGICVYVPKESILKEMAAKFE